MRSTAAILFILVVYVQLLLGWPRTACAAPSAPVLSGAKAQIAHDIKLLQAGSSDERNAAVADLCKQSPTVATSALKAARAATADEMNHWWIDAALQAVAQPVTPPPTRPGSSGGISQGGVATHDFPPQPQVVTALGADSEVVDAAQDSTGKVWGIVGWYLHQVYSWNAAGWSPEPLDSQAVSRPFLLAVTPTGAVLCAWEAVDGIRVSVNRGSVHRTLGTIPALHSADISLLFADHDDAWLVSVNGDFYRLDSRVGHDGSPHTEYHIAASQFAPNSYFKPGELPTRRAPWIAAMDGQGHTWFYSSGLKSESDSACLLGALIWNGGKMVAHASFDGFPSGNINDIAAKDPSHVWISAQNGGLYTLDTDTFKAMPEAEPDLKDVQTLFRAGQKWYAVTGTGWPQTGKNAPPGTGGALWRSVGDGGWEEIINGIDCPYFFRVSNTRAFDVTEAGLWIGSVYNSAWFVPTNGDDPKHIDYRYKFALRSVDRIFTVPAKMGGVVAIENNYNNRHSFTVSHVEQLASAKPLRSLADIAVEKVMVQDAHFDIWGVFDKYKIQPDSDPTVGLALQQWNGTTWISHKLPLGFDIGRMQSVSTDSKNRIWIVEWPTYHDKTDSTFRCDPTTDTWVTFANAQVGMAAAAAEVASEHAKNPNAPHFTMTIVADRLASFSDDGRVGYADSNNGAMLYDGTEWKTWRRTDVTGDKDDTFAFDGPVFFDKDGIASVNCNVFQKGRQQGLTGDQRRTYRWYADGGWKSSPYVDNPGDIYGHFVNFRTSMPAAIPRADVSSAVVDRNGAYWLTQKNVLYEFVNGAMTPSMPVGYADPFSDGRNVQNALIDSVGNVFIQTDANSRLDYIMIPKALMK